MIEDHLSVELGRLIDYAKVALQEYPEVIAAEGRTAEAVAVLGSRGSIFAGAGAMHLRHPGEGRETDRGEIQGAEAHCSAAERALELWKEGGEEEIAAIALASADSGDEDPVACGTCQRALATLDQRLPLVVKRRGRWVVVPLASLAGRQGAGS